MDNIYRKSSVLLEKSGNPFTSQVALSKFSLVNGHSNNWLTSAKINNRSSKNYFVVWKGKLATSINLNFFKYF